MSGYPEFADPMQRPRYSGIPTFMRAPASEDVANVDIALVGVPFDGGEICFVADDDIPRSASGKVQRHVLEKRLEAR